MESLLATLSSTLTESELRQTVIGLLMGVPGLPPVLQSLHILGVAAVVAALIVPSLKVLGVAAHEQDYNEMLVRLRPWAWGALLMLFLSGTAFVIARPDRYFFNPIAGIKLGCLAAALSLAFLGQRLARRNAPDFSLSDKGLAGLALLAWAGVVFAGRWIAYVDYLFWEA